jgi:hypothetical protein
MNRPDDPITDHIRQQLDRQTVDADTRRRLRLARAQALEAGDAPGRLPGNPASRAGLALAGIAALALLLMPLLDREPGPAPADGLVAFEIATSSEPLEFYQELEFYLWLEQQEETG